jgi:hypothetical protein
MSDTFPKSDHLQHGMVEMRWVQHPNEGSELQYRYVSYDWARPHENWRWTDWRSVPAVAKEDTP